MPIQINGCFFYHYKIGVPVIYPKIADPNFYVVKEASAINFLQLLNPLQFNFIGRSVNKRIFFENHVAGV